jgi:hypothetical protein
MRPGLQRHPAARQAPENFPQRFRIRTHALFQLDLASSSSTQYQLWRSPRSNPMVSFC